jgi:hypothetical protein
MIAALTKNAAPDVETAFTQKSYFTGIIIIQTVRPIIGTIPACRQSFR